jgi:hypothetical protein
MYSLCSWLPAAWEAAASTRARLWRSRLVRASERAMRALPAMAAARRSRRCSPPEGADVGFDGVPVDRHPARVVFVDLHPGPGVGCVAAVEGPGQQLGGGLAGVEALGRGAPRGGAHFAVIGAHVARGTRGPAGQLAGQEHIGGPVESAYAEGDIPAAAARPPARSGAGQPRGRKRRGAGAGCWLSRPPRWPPRSGPGALCRGRDLPLPGRAQRRAPPGRGDRAVGPRLTALVTSPN